MSQQKEHADGTGLVAERTGVYNDDGMTSIPNEIMDRLDVEGGDDLVWVGYGDKILVSKLDDE